MTLRERWIAALRGGQYVQGRRMLRKGDTFCCLGVLCDLYDKLGWETNEEKPRWRSDEMGFSRHISYEDSASCPGSDLPPPALLRAVGISRQDAVTLTTANDDQQLSFKEIADMIEEWGKP